MPGGRADRDFSGAQNEHPKTAEKVAEEQGVNYLRFLNHACLVFEYLS